MAITFMRNDFISPAQFDAAREARVILVIGSRDSGKTTFVTRLANELFRQGYSVGVIDSDIGQSDIGPPTTIGLGIVGSELQALGDIKLQSLYFVGSITPRGHLSSMLIGSRQLLDRALACELQKILIDTTGFISGQTGRILKQQKIQILNPDLLICLQTQQECEHILKAYSSLDRPEILRLTPAAQRRHKSQSARQKYRRDAFQRYFARAREVHVSLSETGIFESNLFTGRPLTAQERSETLQAISDMQGNKTSRAPNVKTPQIHWGEWIDEELLLISGQALPHSQILALKKNLPAIRYIHNSGLDEFQNLLLGLLDAHGECCGLGILKAIDFDAGQALIVTPLEQEKLKAIQFSRYQLESTAVGRRSRSAGNS